MSTYEIKLHPIENDFIACLDTTKTSQQPEKPPSKVETIIILDRSGSMGGSVYKIIHSVLPKFFELLSYDPDTLITLIAFESSTEVHQIKAGDFKDTKLHSAGGTSMAPAVTKLHEIFESLQSSVTALRLLTISDGEVYDQDETKVLGQKLSDFAEKCNILVNSQAVRLFTSRSQPDTTALCSLLRLGNVEKSQLIDVGAQKHHDKIATEMADLFLNDGFGDSKVMRAGHRMFYKFPWDAEAVDQLLILPNRRNVFWIDEIPKNDEIITIEGRPVTVTVEKDTSLDTFQLLLSAKLDFVVDRMKVLKIVDTDTARQTIEKMVEYFSRIEAVLAGLVTNETVDPKSIANRARLLKLNRIRSKKISTFMRTIANDDEVCKLNAAQKAAYLRSVEASSKSGRGLAKRAAKKKAVIGAKQLSFDEIVHKEVLNIKQHFHEISDISHKGHSVSFYSQATTIEGIRMLIELADDPTFKNFTAEEILQILNLVGVACSSPIGDFPDASTWRVNDIYYGCYVSVADIITSIHQSSDSGFVLKAPGLDKEITSVIPVFDDPRIGVFLKTHAASILEFTSSIGMRRVIADVPMTFGYNIIAGIRRMIYDLNKHKSTLHLETFKQLVATAASFVGKYHDHVEGLLKDKECGDFGYYLANNGIASLIVPLIRVYNRKGHEAVKRMPDILRSIYSCEIYKGIGKEFKGKQNFNDIVKDMLYKLLNIDIQAHKVQVASTFEDEPVDVKFYDNFKVNQEYLDKLTQPLYYHNYMSLLPQFLSTDDPKNVPEMTKKTFLDALDINYDYKEFLFLNVFQALRYPRSLSRIDAKKQSMKVIDLKNYTTAVDDVKKYVREQFELAYATDLRTKSRDENTFMAETLVNNLVNESHYPSLIRQWTNGITVNKKVYKIGNSSAAGFKLLCLKLIDTRVTIPLRSKIIAVLLTGRDADGQLVYNNGEICDLKLIKKYKKRFLMTETAEAWEAIEASIKGRACHVYRQKVNRRGHGNEKPSFWAKGFNQLIDFLRLLSEEERNEYIDGHQRCCDANNVRWELYKEQWRLQSQDNETDVSEDGSREEAMDVDESKAEMEEGSTAV